MLSQVVSWVSFIVQISGDEQGLTHTHTYTHENDRL